MHDDDGSATLLPTSHVIENGVPGATTPRLADIELQEPDFNKFTELARRKTPAASLSQATGGDLGRSLARGTTLHAEIPLGA